MWRNKSTSTLPQCHKLGSVDLSLGRKMPRALSLQTCSFQCPNFVTIILIGCFLFSALKECQGAKKCMGYCFREGSSPYQDCVTNKNLTEEADCHDDSKDKSGNVRCFTFQMYNHGTLRYLQGKGNDDNEKVRKGNGIDGRGCLVGYGPVGWGGPDKTMKIDRESCAKQHLNIKMVDGKCIKGLYPRDHVTKFLTCANGEFNMGNPGGLMLDTSDNGKGNNLGLYWGEFGNVQYINVVVCSCTGPKCNKEQENTFKKAIDPATAARVLRMGILRTIRA